jgi:hypothetical protein
MADGEEKDGGCEFGGDTALAGSETWAARNGVAACFGKVLAFVAFGTVLMALTCRVTAVQVSRCPIEQVPCNGAKLVEGSWAVEFR